MGFYARSKRWQDEHPEVKAKERLRYYRQFQKDCRLRRLQKDVGSSALTSNLVSLSLRIFNDLFKWRQGWQHDLAAVLREDTRFLPFA